MSLQHTFYIIDSEIINRKQKIDETAILNNNYDKIILSDQLIMYLMDTMKWIPSFNLAKSKSDYGINYHGITLFKEEGLKKLYKIINAWIVMFSNASEHIELKGSFMFNDDNEGYYEKILYEKNDLLILFNSFKNLIKKAINLKMFLIHFGI